MTSNLVDLTAITTPFGLLDEVYGPGTQEVLKNSGGPYEIYTNSTFQDGAWYSIDDPMWSASSAYRVKPAPPKPREWWITNWGNGETHLYGSSDEAESAAKSLERNGWRNVRVIHVREVLP